MKVDFKKTYFEKALNSLPVGVSTNSIYKIMRQFGYHYEYENNKYYVYTDYEWSVKREFEKEISPLLRKFFRK